MIDHSQKRQFYVQLIDNDSFIATDEFCLGSFSIEEIANTLECDSAFLEPGNFFCLEGRSKHKAEEILGVNLSQDGREANLVSWSESDGLPYRMHAGREFILMKDRLKPLSVFTSMVPSSPESLKLPTQLFAPLVNDEKVVMRSYCEVIDKNPIFKGLEVVLYADIAEEWRIEAYILLRSIAKKIGWSEPLTRMEGALLGYSEWQNDAFIAAASF